MRNGKRRSATLTDGESLKLAAVELMNSAQRVFQGQVVVVDLRTKLLVVTDLNEVLSAWYQCRKHVGLQHLTSFLADHHFHTDMTENRDSLCKTSCRDANDLRGL